MLSDSVTFTDMELPTSAALDRNRNQHNGTVPYSWARVRVSIPNGYDELVAVKRWLSDNTTALWSFGFYDDFTAHKTIVTVRFQSVDDALVFKLSDGYKAWESN